MIFPSGRRRRDGRRLVLGAPRAPIAEHRKETVRQLFGHAHGLASIALADAPLDAPMTSSVVSGVPMSAPPKTDQWIVCTAYTQSRDYRVRTTTPIP